MDVYYVDFGSQVSALGDQPVRVRKIKPAAGVRICRKKLLASLFCLFIVLAVQLVLRVLITEKGYEIERMRAIALNNDVELRELDLAYAYKTRPAEVIKMAQQKLGMEPIAPSQIRKITY